MVSTALTAAARSCLSCSRQQIQSCASTVSKRTNKLRGARLFIDETTSTRYLVQRSWFSDMPPAPNQNSDIIVEEPIKVTPRHALSVLEKPFTPGQALFVLQKKGADGSLISKKDLTQLCEASRSEHYNDAVVIQNAIIQFHNHWKFELKDPKLATTIMDGMIRAILRTDKENEAQYWPESKIRAGLFVANAFGHRDTRLYYAMESTDIERFLSLLWEGLEESYSPSSLDDSTEGDEAEKSKVQMKREEPAKLASLYLINPDRSVLRRRIKKRTRILLRRIFGKTHLPKSKLKRDFDKDLALKIVKQVFYSLLIRSSNPESKMSKKGKRMYSKRLVVKDDPTKDYNVIVELITNICGILGGSAEAKDIVEMWEKKIGYAGSGVETGGLWAIVSELEEIEKSSEEDEIEEESDLEQDEEEVELKDESSEKQN